MNFQPIIRTGREYNVNQLWIEHAATNIRDGGGDSNGNGNRNRNSDGCNVIVSGTVTIQSLRRCKHRLEFQDLTIKGVTGDALPPEQLSKLHIYVIPVKTTKVIDAIHDQDEKGMYMACVRDYIVHASEDMHKLDDESAGSNDKLGTQGGEGAADGNSDNDQKEGSRFHIPIPEYICKVHVTKVFSIAIVLMHQNMPVAVIASGDFKPSTISFRPRILNPTSNGVNESIRKGFILASTARLLQNEPLDLQTIAEYTSKSRSFMRCLGKSEAGRINFEEFQIGLDHMNIILLETRARALFDSCDAQNLGFLGIDDVVNALMVNDSLPSSTLFVNVRELFSCFDVEERGRLSFRQFTECIGTPGLKSRVRSVQDGFIHYLFRKYANPNDSTINFDSFVKLWSRHLVDETYELEQRGIQCQSVGRKTRMAETVIPVLKSRRQKDRLYKQVISEEYDFQSARQKVMEQRINAKKVSDGGRRKSRHVARKQRRETVISSSTRGKSHRLFLQSLINAEARSENQRWGTTMDLKRTTTLTREAQREEIIRNRIEKDSKEQKAIRDTLSDRLLLVGCNLQQIPEDLYTTRQSQAKLADVKMMDVSENLIEWLPENNFFFHLIALRKLSLSMNKIKCLPEEIGSLKNLEILLLNQNEIEILPSSLDKLKALQVLEISTNKLQSLPTTICHLSGLRILSAYSNALSVLPQNFGMLEKLEFLDINNNHLGSLPNSMSSLKHLVKINVSSNELIDLPSQFGEMEKLEDLDLSFNMIQELPASISNLNQLKMVNLEHNRLPWIPHGIKGFKKVVTFSCEKNCIVTLSREIGKMDCAVHVSCAMNKIESIPDELGLLRNLRHLDFQCNRLQSVPVEIGGLVSLQSLDLSHNLIEELPHEFCFMRNMVYLDISHNKLQCLPEHLGVFFNLSTLKVSNNRLSALPQSFKNLKNLAELCAASNQFEEIQKLICDLENLKLADFANNMIQYLPIEIVSMPRLNELNLRHNNLKALPLEFNPEDLNVNSLPLKLDITKNPLSDLPSKFASTDDRRFGYENPSGYSKQEVFSWADKEKLVYKSAVEEWTANKDSYLSADILFRDFHQGVVWRCENFGGLDENDVALLTGNEYTTILKRFFFYCKKRGNPPMYVQLDDDETSRLEREYKQLQRIRDERTEEARLADLKRRAEEYERYFGRLNERCMEANTRFDQVEADRRKNLNDRNRQLNCIVQNRVKAMEKQDKENEVNEAMEAKREAQELNQLSFAKYQNKKRLLPLEIQPCWKKDASSVQ